MTLLGSVRALLVCSLAVAAGCGDDGKKNAAATGGASSTGGAGGASGGAVSGGSDGSGGSGGTVISACATPPDLGVHWVGRVDGCDERGARYGWPGSGFVGRFSGTGIGVKMVDTNQHTVLIDGQLMPTLKATTGEKVYPLASDLEPGEHTFEVYKRTEASFGTTVVEAFEVTGGELLAPPAAPTRHIEVIGDSITCGYGVEGVLPCMFSADTENHYVAYAAVLARSLEAELSTVAISGKGVIYNYNGDPRLPLPIVWDRVTPDDKKNPWSFAVKVDAVVINLGTNDYSTANAPSTEMFVSAYQSLLERVRGAYPDAFILCTVGPLLTGGMLTTARTNINTAVTARNTAGDAKVKVYEMKTTNLTPYGCDYHPNVPTQKAMATELETVLRSELGW